MPIQIDNPARADIRALLNEHLADMAVHSPPESTHALNLSALQADDITFVSARTEAGQLQGCAALKTLTERHGELKSMRTARPHLRRGVAAGLLDYLIAMARERGMQRLSLETGTPAAFLPARKLYSRFGFVTCPPFASYVEDPYSAFMTLSLSGTSPITSQSSASRSTTR